MYDASYAHLTIVPTTIPCPSLSTVVTKYRSFDLVMDSTDDTVRFITEGSGMSSIRAMAVRIEVCSIGDLSTAPAVRPVRVRDTEVADRNTSVGTGVGTKVSKNRLVVGVTVVPVVVGDHVSSTPALGRVVGVTVAPVVVGDHVADVCPLVG